jgi:hypothetical protein
MGVARILNGEAEIVGGGFIGNSCLFQGRNDDVWVFSNGLPATESWALPQVTLLGKSLGDEQRTTINYPPAHGINAAFITEGRFLIVGAGGVATVEPGGQIRILNRDQYMGLVRLTDQRFLLSTGGVDLLELDLATDVAQPVAKLRLQGLISELAKSRNEGGYVFTHYPKADGATAGVVVRWSY